MNRSQWRSASRNATTEWSKIFAGLVDQIPVVYGQVLVFSEELHLKDGLWHFDVFKKLYL